MLHGVFGIAHHNFIAATAIRHTKEAKTSNNKCSMLTMSAYMHISIGNMLVTWPDLTLCMKSKRHRHSLQYHEHDALKHLTD